MWIIVFAAFPASIMEAAFGRLHKDGAGRLCGFHNGCMLWIACISTNAVQNPELGGPRRLTQRQDPMSRVKKLAQEPGGLFSTN